MLNLISSSQHLPLPGSPHLLQLSSLLNSCAMHTTHAVISSPAILAAIAPIHRWVSGHPATERDVTPNCGHGGHTVWLCTTLHSLPHSVPGPLVLPDCAITEQKLTVPKLTVTNFGLKTNQPLTPRPHLSSSWKLQSRSWRGKARKHPDSNMQTGGNTLPHWGPG